MAKIEMDLSEYKRMEQTEFDLRDALDKQKEQADKIEKLQQEKVEIMEQNKKQVTIVEEVKHIAVVNQNLSTNKVMDMLANFLGIDRKDLDGIIKNNLKKDSFFIDDINFSRMNPDYGYGSAYSSYHYKEAMIRRLQEVFFSEKKEILKNVDKTVSYKGLDDVRADIAREYFDILSQETKDKLNRLKDLSKKNKHLEESNKGLRTEVKIANKNQKELENELNKVYKEMNLTKDKFTELEGSSVPMLTAYATMEILKNQNGIFGNKKAIDELKKIWENAGTRK